MLYAQFVRAYTYTVRIHMMCTPFLVYTYAIHSCIALHVALLYDCLFPLFIFKLFFLVYTNGIHNLCALHLLGILYFTGI